MFDICLRYDKDKRIFTEQVLHIIQDNLENQFEEIDVNNYEELNDLKLALLLCKTQLTFQNVYFDLKKKTDFVQDLDDVIEGVNYAEQYTSKSMNVFDTCYNLFDALFLDKSNVEKELLDEIYKCSKLMVWIKWAKADAESK